jgi:hypothetical protein
VTDSVGTKDAGAALPRAEYQILGKTKFDQLWIDKTIEGEVKGFGFKRPLKRPASFDAAPASHSVVLKPATPSAPETVTVVPKKHWWQRIHIKKKPE